MTEKTVKIIAVGDIFLGEHPFTLGHGVATIAKEKGCGFLFSEIKEHLKGADIVCGNLEGIISPKKKEETGIKSAIFWGEPECAKVLKTIGFNCLFLANNHTTQHGIDALKRTCQLLDKNNIKWTGFNEAKPNSPIPAIFQFKGLKLGLLAYCETQQYHLDTPILPVVNIENIKRDINNLQKDCDIILISLHWGDEFIDYPSPKQIQMAHKIIDSGAHLILGHHSHTMQGIERYKHGLIAYSLGSFVKDLWQHKLRKSVILKCEISAKGIKNFDIVPIFINNDWQPEIYEGEEGEKIIKKVESLSKAIGNLTLNEYENVQKKYMQEVKRLLIKDKLDIALHYITNIFRYDKSLLLENISLMVKRRVYKKNI
jgi:poly-gamma-glutamate synthesis protein (capsule biosynthesis protein)